jgi:cytochrome b561
MELSLPVTLTILALTLGMFAFAYWRGSLPAQPLKVRMVNYHVVQIICVVVVLLMVAHLVTLVSGQPLPPRGGGRRF